MKSNKDWVISSQASKAYNAMMKVQRLTLREGVGVDDKEMTPK